MGFLEGVAVSRETMFIGDNDRYDRLRLISWWDQDKLGSARILVVGAGALGNEVLKNLTLLGIGNIFLIDFDRIESSNLSRSVFFRDSDRGQSKSFVAAERAAELNPDVTITPIEDDVMTSIGLGFLKSIDVVIGCLDNREARLWVNRMCWKACVPWIDGGIQEINGVVKVYGPPEGSCYECTMTKNDYRLISLRYSCPLLKQEDIQAGRVPTAPTIASMIGGLQVQEMLKLLHQIPTDMGTALVFNGLANQFYKSQLPRREDCLSHETYTEIFQSSLNHDATVGELFSFAENRAGAIATLALDRDFVMRFDCNACGNGVDVGRPAMQVRQKESACVCGDTMRPEMISEIVPGSQLTDRSLKDVGIPDWDLVKLLGVDGREFAVGLEPCLKK